MFNEKGLYMVPSKIDFGLQQNQEFIKKFVMDVGADGPYNGRLRRRGPRGRAPQPRRRRVAHRPDRHHHGDAAAR